MMIPTTHNIQITIKITSHYCELFACSCTNNMADFRLHEMTFILTISSSFRFVSGNVRFVSGTWRIWFRLVVSRINSESRFTKYEKENTLINIKLSDCWCLWCKQNHLSDRISRISASELFDLYIVALYFYPASESTPFPPVSLCRESTLWGIGSLVGLLWRLSCGWLVGVWGSS